MATPQRRVAITLVSDTITKDLMSIGPEAVGIVKGVLGDEMKKVAEKARQLTPIDIEDGGQLQDSVRATRPTKTGSGRVSAGVRAGGKSAPYANIQHEDLTFKHTYGTAKFLERPFKQALPGIITKLRAAIGRRLERGR